MASPVAALLVQLRVDVLGQLLGLRTLTGTGDAPAVRRDGVDRRVAHEVGPLGALGMVPPRPLSIMWRPAAREQ